MLRQIPALTIAGSMFVLVGCSEREATPVIVDVVYVDLETRQPVVMSGAVDAPAINPATGRRTLMPGLHCSQCQDWHATPPLEALQRNPAARRCPKCQSVLTASGPMPVASNP